MQDKCKCKERGSSLDGPGATPPARGSGPRADLEKRDPSLDRPGASWLRAGSGRGSPESLRGFVGGVSRGAERRRGTAATGCPGSRTGVGETAARPRGRRGAGGLPRRAGRGAGTPPDAVAQQQSGARTRGDQVVSRGCPGPRRGDVVMLPQRSGAPESARRNSPGVLGLRSPAEISAGELSGAGNEAGGTITAGVRGSGQSAEISADWCRALRSRRPPRAPPVSWRTPTRPSLPCRAGARWEAPARSARGRSRTPVPGLPATPLPKLVPPPWLDDMREPRGSDHRERRGRRPLIRVRSTGSVGAEGP